MLWLLLATARAACPEPVLADAFGQQVEDVEEAFIARDVDGLQNAATTARNALPCVSEPLERTDIAAFYRSQGVALFIAGDRGGAVEMLASARNLEPDYTFPEEMLGQGHPLRQVYDNIPGDAAVTTTLSPPQVGTLLIDGRPGLLVPTDRPYVLQHVAVDGSVLDTQLISKGGTPVYPEQVAPPTEQPTAPEDPHPEVPASTRSPRIDAAVLVGFERTTTPNETFEPLSTVQALLSVHARLVSPLGIEVAAPLGFHLGPKQFGWSLRAGPRVTLGDRLHASLSSGVRASFNTAPDARFIVPAGYGALGAGAQPTDRIGLRIELTSSYGRDYIKDSRGKAFTLAAHAGLNVSL